MKKFWLDKKQCTGCGACMSICPKKAIDMRSDECGFIYPHISNLCIECGICEKTCKSRGSVSLCKRLREPMTYAAWSQDPLIRYNSTSGGVFSELAQFVLKNGGYVVGAQYTVDNLVEHTIVSNMEGLEKIRQSKYIQSHPNNIYVSVKEKLLNKRQVLFCGSPCQVAALYAFLGREFSELITVDFICRGMNSPKAFKAWLDEIEKEEGSKVSKVWFKYKDGGWKTSPKRTRIDFTDGHFVVKEGSDNLFMHGYLTSNLYIRPSCSNCSFKGVPRQSDLTIADFWGVDVKLDDDKGTSLVLVNSDKGMSLFDSVKENLSCHKREFKEIFSRNVCFTDSVHVPEKSRDFLIDLDNDTFSSVLKRYTHLSISKRIKRKILKLFNRL